MNPEAFWRIYARFGYVFGVLFWLVLGGIAGLWWVPDALGESKPIPWTMGASCLFILCVLVFNHWPRLGTRRFFRESPLLKYECTALVVVATLFALGFAVASPSH